MLYYFLIFVELAGIPPKQRATFEEDLSDLASESAHVLQKIGTIERMYRTHAFLSPNMGK